MKIYRSIVICHFYNEEYMLPYWLEHHVKIFDHGVMINNGSDDASVDIIRRLAPNWEIVNTAFKCLDALLLDFVVQQQEARFNCWKICLNVSEFITSNLPNLLDEYEQADLLAIQTHPYIMVDPDRDVELIPGLSLIEQKPYGFYDNFIYDFFTRDQKLRKLFYYFMQKRHAYKRRARLLHRYPIGGYSIGRHNWFHTSSFDKRLRMYWYGYSPNTHCFIERKISFGATLPLGENKLGQHHKVNNALYLKRYRLHLNFLKFFGEKLND